MEGLLPVFAGAVRFTGVERANTDGARDIATNIKSEMRDVFICEDYIKCLGSYVRVSPRWKE